MEIILLRWMNCRHSSENDSNSPDMQKMLADTKKDCAFRSKVRLDLCI